MSLKGVRQSGDRTGNWLTREQARELLAQPGIETTEGKRDRAILAVLLGCALRRSELAALECGHIQQRDGRWVFVDLLGKGKRIRTVPIPPFVKVAIDAWTAAAGLSKGPLFRRVRRRKYSEKTPEALSERMIWHIGFCNYRSESASELSKYARAIRLRDRKEARCEAAALQTSKERRIIMKLPLFVSCAVILSSALAIAQTPLTANQQMTTGVVGITPGQTARINVLYPTAPAPILQPLCSVTLNIADDQGKILKTLAVSQFVAGRSVSLDLNADTDLTGSPRTEIHGFSVAPTGCKFTGTLELIDNITQKTVLVIGSRQTYPAEH